MDKILETDRLYIRPLEVADKEFIYRIVNSEDWIKYIGDRQIKNTDDAEKYILKILNEKKGFTTEAIQKYLEKIVIEISDDKILAFIVPQNSKSIHLIEKIGFTFEGKIEINFETLYQYSLTNYQ